MCGRFYQKAELFSMLLAVHDTGLQDYKFVNLGFQELPLGNGHQKEKFQVLPRLVGSIYLQKIVALQALAFVKKIKK